MEPRPPLDAQEWSAAHRPPLFSLSPFRPFPIYQKAKFSQSCAARARPNRIAERSLDALYLRFSVDISQILFREEAHFNLAVHELRLKIYKIYHGKTIAQQYGTLAIFTKFCPACPLLILLSVHQGNILSYPRNWWQRGKWEGGSKRKEGRKRHRHSSKGLWGVVGCPTWRFIDVIGKVRASVPHILARLAPKVVRQEKPFHILV